MLGCPALSLVWYWKSRTRHEGHPWRTIFYKNATELEATLSTALKREIGISRWVAGWRPYGRSYDSPGDRKSFSERRFFKGCHSSQLVGQGCSRFSLRC